MNNFFWKAWAVVVSLLRAMSIFGRTAYLRNTMSNRDMRQELVYVRMIKGKGRLRSDEGMMAVRSSSS